MKKLTLFLEDDFFEVLKDFKLNGLKDKSISDEKAMTLLSRYFMETYKKN